MVLVRQLRAGPKSSALYGKGRWAVRRLMLLMAVMGATVLLVSGVALAATIIGTEGPDLLSGTGAKDLIKGLGGGDKINGKGKGDELQGNEGFDFVCGENGSDTSYGGAGEDKLSEYDISQCALTIPPDGDGYTGADTQFGGEGADFLEGARGPDTEFGGPNPDDDEDDLYGDTGGDELHGGLGPDYMEGEQGSDQMFGDAGDDYLDAADEETVDTPDVVNGGDGIDTCIVNPNDTVSNCEIGVTVPNPTLTTAASATADDVEGNSR